MDPYARIAGFCRRQGAKDNPPTIGTGTVTSPPPNLIIEFNDMPLYKDDILIADFLLSNYSRDISSDITNATISKITTTDTSLSEGDTVAMMPLADGQKYLLLCKVVSI
jgi:hypothetical protein